MEITWRVVNRGVGGGGGKVQRISSIDDRWKIDGEGKNSVGNVEGRGWAGWSGVGGGKWDNCNSIINKYI